MLLAVVFYPKLSEKYSADNTPSNTNSETVVQVDDFTVYDSEMNKVKLSDYLWQTDYHNLLGSLGVARVNLSFLHLILSMRNIRMMLCS